MRYLTLGEVVELHRRLLEATGSAPAIRDSGALDLAGLLAYSAPTSKIRDLDQHTRPGARAAIPHASCATGRDTPPKPSDTVQPQ